MGLDKPNEMGYCRGMEVVMDYRAYWKGETTQDLRFGMEGLVFKASGHHDPESAEYQAWLFQPDDALHLGGIIGPNDEQVAFYCEWKDFDILEAASEGNGYPAGTIGAETR
jgi:hypothetical protein